MYRRTSDFLVKEQALLGQKLSSVSHRYALPKVHLADIPVETPWSAVAIDVRHRHSM
jgi:hypothetical protein